MVSPRPSPRNISLGIILKQIGDGSLLSLSSPARPSTVSPRRAPLFGGEAQRALFRDRMRAVDTFDTARRYLFELELERAAHAEERRQVEQARLDQLHAANAQHRALMERITREKEEICKAEARERREARRRDREERYGKADSGKEITKDAWAWMGGSREVV